MESAPGPSRTSPATSPDLSLSRIRLTRARKRRYISSDSSSDIEPVLPENILEVEKNLHASAVKNNLDDVSVKKILKKVVTNDHVLALVKLREEEENKAEEENMQPKLTRAKVKELMKVSPKTAWNLENMELTPIKHIPVRTRPEVKALIAQELPEDEDDDEYEPTYDDVPSDDDQTLESCSDVDSQPRTPATPRTASPKVPVKDGPFKVPQMTTPRRKLDMDGDATIALRTRSKLSLSSIPIDHIESSFVPPDELPMPAVDDVWSEFLQECLDPEIQKEVDDDDDPEYDVAADPESHDEEEEGLDNILKISKKELNDLVTELFNVMPEGLGDEVLTGKLASDAPQNNGNKATPCAFKQEVISDDEDSAPRNSEAQAKRLSTSRGKSKPVSDNERQGESEKENQQNNNATPAVPNEVTLSVVEGSVGAVPPRVSLAAPAPLLNLLVTQSTLTVEVQQGAQVLAEQIEILQQQIRQHIQLATSNFLQLYVHPIHWALGPIYREYLETLTKITTENPKSVASVCNLKPAMELVMSWQKSVSEDTPENAEMVRFIQSEVDRSRKRAANNSLYVGNFHKTLLSTVANSQVFLYPHLLPPLPYRSDGIKRTGYTASEDELIALGIDEFWQYVEENPDIYKVRSNENGNRWGLVTVVALMCKHMFPWMLPRALLAHIQHVRRTNDADNPIIKFFKDRDVTPVKHVLLPYNPKLTLYQQPESELPRIWVRYLAKTSSRFRKFLYKRSGNNPLTGHPLGGVPVEMGAALQPPSKPPLPSDFINCPNRRPIFPVIAPKPKDKFDVPVVDTTAETTNVLYSVIQTPAGAYLIPLTVLTNTVNTASTPICSSQIQENIKDPVPNNIPEKSVANFTVTLPDSNAEDIVKESTVHAPVDAFDHCECCIRLRKIAKTQRLITDYFGGRKEKDKSCPCKIKREEKYPRVTKKFKLLLEIIKKKPGFCWKKLRDRIIDLGRMNSKPAESYEYDPDDIAAATAFQLKLLICTMNSKNSYMKKRVQNFLYKFDPDTFCPVKVMKDMVNVLNEDCEYMYTECLTLLTMEQADKLGKYLDYFKQEYLRDLMQKIEELVPDKCTKLRILLHLQRTVDTLGLSPCEVCAKILEAVAEYPRLAEYTFSLFPHRRPEAPLADKAVEEKPKDIQNKTDKAVEIPKDIQNKRDKAVVEIPKGIKNKRDKAVVEMPKDIQNHTDKAVVETAKEIQKHTDKAVVETAKDIQNHTDKAVVETAKDIQNHTEKAVIETEKDIQNKTEKAVVEMPNDIQTTVKTRAMKMAELQAASAAKNRFSVDIRINDAQNTVANQQTTDQTEVETTPLATDIPNATVDQPMEPAVDNVTADPSTTDNGEESVLDETHQTMDYEADHSSSDDDSGEYLSNLTIVEEPDRIHHRRSGSFHNENTEQRGAATSEYAMDTSERSVTKIESPDYSESDMSTMIMSEDEIVKKEPAEWNRDEDKLVLKVLQQSLTPEEMKDKTILEIIEQKKVLQLAAENLPEKTLDDVRERMLYLLEFLVNQQ